MPADFLFAQSELKKEEHALKITGRSFGESIRLRWAPTSMYAWRESNKVGYVLERFTLRRGQEVLPLAERKQGKILTTTPLKPLTEGEDWRPLMEKNDYAAIAAQALYGKSFQMTGGGKNLNAKKDEQQNRYSFGLFAADQSLEVAAALGLYFEDQDVRKGEYYLYKIYPAQAIKEMAVDTGFLYLGTDEVFQLPKVTEVQVEFGDQVAYLSWDKTMFDHFYSSYEVERSEDGQNFEAVNALPFVGLDKGNKREARMLLMDSLAINDQVYIYRVKGKTIFDEVGPPSDPVQGMGVNPKVSPPAIDQISNNEKTGVGIGWELQPENEKEILGFQLRRSSSEGGTYELLSGDKYIDKTLRYFIDENPLPKAYYKIVAIDKYGRELPSYAALAQMDDDTPPAPPTGIRGTVMEDGTMVLSWTPNTEPDIMGYRIYLANRKGREEYVQITPRPVKTNFFSYLVPMNTLSEEIFIKIRALDFRQNKSDFSEIATIMRPDSLPPAAPIFISARPSSEAVQLSWENSASVDVVSMVLERLGEEQTEWKAIKTMTYPMDTNVKTYRDTTVERGQRYTYRLKTTDDAGLITYSRNITATKIDNGIRRAILEVVAAVDRKSKKIALQWNYEPDGKDLSHFVIYRSEEKERPRKYDMVKKSKSQSGNDQWVYEDSRVKMDTNYHYQVRAVYRSGAQTPLTQILAVPY